MASSKEHRQAFIDSLKHFLARWNFRGVEINWEWPAAPSRGGDPADTLYQAVLAVELRQALGSNFGLSIALPAQYEYLKGFYLSSLEMEVDFFNLLSYDLHGSYKEGLTLRAKYPLTSIFRHMGRLCSRLRSFS